MKTIIATLFLTMAISAQEADAPVRVNHLTKIDIDSIKEAQDVVQLAMKHEQDVIDGIYKAHGILIRDEKNCTPFDNVDKHGNSTLIITRITPHRDEYGDCLNDYYAGSSEGITDNALRHDILSGVSQ